MNVVMAHYHLNRGGVTSVIVNHIHALDASTPTKEQNNILVLYCGDKIGWDDSFIADLKHTTITLQTIPQLKYDKNQITYQPELLAKALEEAISAHFGTSEPPVIHIHNHTLGKNVSLPEAVRILATKGHPIVAQIHDFPEDGRPGNYKLLLKYVGKNKRARLLGNMYPKEKNMIYATINKRDWTVLHHAGISRNRLFTIQNPVLPITPAIDKKEARIILSQSFQRQGLSPLSDSERFILYPVRGIRRKNIGEALLWSLLVPSNIRFGMTLSPINPAEKTQYNAWERFRTRYNLNFGFGLSENINLGYADILNASDGVLTTSVAEGFGMAYLEPWLIDLPVFGRLLSEITADFTSCGMNYEGTYMTLNVPASYIDPQRFADRFVTQCLRVYKSYGIKDVAEKTIARWITNKLSNGPVDFGFLDEIAQRKVIQGVLKHGADEILKLNPGFKKIINAMIAPNVKNIKDNKQIVAKYFSICGQGKKIREVYKHVFATKRNLQAKQKPAPPIKFFLDLSRLKMLRM